MTIWNFFNSICRTCMQRSTVLALVFALSLLSAVAGYAQAPVQIVSEGQADRRIPVAVPEFDAGPGAEEISRGLAAVVSSDLTFSGLVQVLPKENYPPAFQGYDAGGAWQDFAPWKGTTAEYLAYAKILQEGGKIGAECRLFHIMSGNQELGKKLTGDANTTRLIAHRYADEIILKLTGVAGIASSEICFSGGVTGKKEIYIADYDGARITQVTKHGSISIRPKFSPDGTKIAYLSFKEKYPFLYLYDRQTGQSVPLSKHVGLNSSPSWAPDGRMLAIVLSKDGNTEIYLTDITGASLRRITNNKWGDTSPTFSPSGKQIAFVSDSAGVPQIFSMNTDGSNVQRLSYQGGRSYDPAWSPDGKSIAYVAEKSGEGTEIYVMDAGGSNSRRVTDSGGSNESPSWSPDSRHVVFCSSRSGASELWCVNVETGQERRLPLKVSSAEGPSWGPRR